jgi:uncharacterized protein (DUF736 family)
LDAIKAAIGAVYHRKEFEMIIGTFTKENDGFVGTLHTLTVNAKAKFVPAEGTKDKSPDLHVIVGKVEIGAAWHKTSSQGSAYYLVKLDDPTFAKAIFARLPVDGGQLVWAREPSKNADKED